MDKSDNPSNERILKLIEVIMRVAGGDYSARAGLSGLGDDIDSLARGIDMMIDDVGKAHKALKQSEKKFKAQYKGMPIPTYTWRKKRNTDDFVLIDYNDAARVITRGGVIDYIGKSAREIYTGRKDIVDDLVACFKEKEVIRREMTLRFVKNTILKYLDVTYVFVPPDLVMVHTEDISERKRAQEEILFKNALLEIQSEASVEGILAVDNNGKVMSHNKRFKEIWEVPEEMIETGNGREIISFAVKKLEEPGIFVDKFKYLHENKHEKSRDEIRLKDGRIIDMYSNPLISSTGDYFGRIWFSRDITEMRAMQETIVQQEKLAVLGQLAGGIGHELRNPLSAVKSSVYFLDMALEGCDPQVKETLQILTDEVANSEKIITNLLDYARAKPPGKKEMSIHEVIERALSRVDIPGGIDVIDHLDDSVPAVMGDPYQLDQVFVNILLNAVQAMPDGGQLVIEAKMTAPDRLTVTVKDTGIGIPPGNLSKLFTPLFTGKAKGIGLGLAIAKSFVEGHGGSIGVKSVEGEGAVFTVELPVSHPPF